MMRVMATMEALKAEDVADLILYVVTRPAYVSINDVLIRPTKQP
jgi:NADP-dependent 3-hydroxy acid dehydrogenase YdfG